MNQEKYESLKSSYMELVTKIIRDLGGLSPAITVLGTRKDDQKNAVIHIPIPDDMMKSDEGKDDFVDQVVPQLAVKINEDFEVSGVAWASEAWMRRIPVNEENPENTVIPEDWKSLPKIEVLFITIESEDKQDTTVMEIVRKGQQVNANGDLTDYIELIPVPDAINPDKVEGRFVGLYKKFTTV